MTIDGVIYRKCDLPVTNRQWQPKGNMPEDYDKGLNTSKLVLRAYVYGAQDARRGKGGDPLAPWA